MVNGFHLNKIEGFFKQWTSAGGPKWPDADAISNRCILKMPAPAPQVDCVLLLPLKPLKPFDIFNRSRSVFQNVQGKSRKA